MNYEQDLRVVVNGVTFPTPAYNGYKVIKRKLNAYAERTPTTMRIGQLGDVWELNIAFPPGLPEETYKTMADALEPFIVTVEFWNPFINARMSTTFYHTDLEISRIWRHIHDQFKIDFIGTEVM